MGKTPDNFLDFKTPRLTITDKEVMKKFMGNLNSIQKFMKENNPNEKYLSKMLVFEQNSENRIAVKKKILGRMNTTRRSELLVWWNQ